MKVWGGKGRKKSRHISLADKLHILWAHCSTHGPSMIFETTRQVEADGALSNFTEAYPQDAYAPSMKGWRLGVCEPAIKQHSEG